MAAPAKTELNKKATKTTQVTEQRAKEKPQQRQNTSFAFSFIEGLVAVALPGLATAQVLRERLNSQTERVSAVEKSTHRFKRHSKSRSILPVADASQVRQAPGKAQQTQVALGLPASAVIDVADSFNTAREIKRWIYEATSKPKRANRPLVQKKQRVVSVRSQYVV